MSTDTIEQRTEIIESKPASESHVRFSVTETSIGPLIEKYLALKVDGPDDKAGLAIATKAKSELRTARTTLEKERLSATEEYREIVKGINSNAAIIKEKIVRAEEHVESLLETVKREAERLEKIRLDERLFNRLELLANIGGIPDIASKQFTPEVVLVMTEQRFMEFVQEMSSLNKSLADEEKERAAAEERNRIESAKIAEERAELARLREAELDRQKAEQDRLDEERRIENERLAAQRAAEAKKQEEELSERRRVAAEEQKANDAKLAEQRRLAAEEQRKIDEQRAEQKRESDRIEAERKKLADEREAKMKAEEQALAEKKRQADAEAQRLENEKLKAESLPVREKILAYRDQLLGTSVPKLVGKFASCGKSISELQELINERLTALAASLEKRRS
jgi:hypothetical protein